MKSPKTTIVAGVANISLQHERLATESSLKADRLFFIYVAKEKEWQQLEREDWNYVSAMTRFFKWWAEHYFGISLPVQADILPIVPGKLFDRMSVAFLIRDHSKRGQDTFHFYLGYFKPLFTDCNTEGYTAPGIGIAWWQRPAVSMSEIQRHRFYADTNCPRVSHILTHELLRMKGKTKKDFFGKVHELWDKHVYNEDPFLYFDSQFKRVSSENSYRFVTINPDRL
ncbi:MAG TPA: hypothetical protein VE521_02445 [Nitrososphaera sp.]|nr:hypothetical protein [Nitrososphaera sp.]